TLELVLRLKPLPTAQTHAHDRVGRLVQYLAHGVERELAVAMASYLLAMAAVEGRQRFGGRRTVLAVVLEIHLGGKRLLDRRRCCGNGRSPLCHRLTWWRRASTSR